MVADALAFEAEAPFDIVLLDAPCSATGTIRRHPDILWSKTPEEVVRLAAVQTRLLEVAARHIAPGGTLVHAVCSLQPEEGPVVVEEFLDGRPDFRRRPISEVEAGLPPTPEGDLRTLPSQMAEAGGMDGFFVSRLVRQGN